MKVVKIFSPPHQQYGYLLYCKYVFDFDEVYFEKSLNKKDNYINENIIDIKFLKTFSETNFNKNLNYTIFFWNGEKQYFENLEIINKLKQDLGEKLNFFFVGNATEVKNVKFAELNKFEKKFRFKNIKLRHYIAFKHPLVFSFMSIFKNIFKFIKYNNKSKICFTGLVKINNEFIYHLKSDWSFSLESIEILNKLKEIYGSTYLDDLLIDKFSNFLISKKYERLPIYEKYFMSQIIFRNCLSIILLKNKNFYLQDWDDRTKIMDNVFYKNFIFLDLGSTAGFEKVYFRYLVLKSFKKKFLRINFFDKYKSLDFNNINLKMVSYLSELNKKNINKLDFSELQNTIKLK